MMLVGELPLIDVGCWLCVVGVVLFIVSYRLRCIVRRCVVLNVGR